jgi:hypothetical protein|eukprot:COSAG06_NODE_1014_length_11069_cov_244.892160_3_plen_33_part_00
MSLDYNIGEVKRVSVLSATRRHEFRAVGRRDH